MRTTKTYMSLPVELTAAELDEKRDELAQSHKKLGELETLKKRLTDAIKGKMSAVLERQPMLATQILSRTEWRQIECDVVYDYKSQNAISARLDTGDVVGVRPMTHEEKQLYLGEEPHEVDKSLMKRAEEYSKRRKVVTDEGGEPNSMEEAQALVDEAAGNEEEPNE